MRTRRDLPKQLQLVSSPQGEGIDSQGTKIAGKLLNLSRTKKEPFDRILSHCAVERLLYRLLLIA